MEDLDFPEVKKGMTLYDRADGKLGTVIDKGILKDLTKYDLDGIIIDAISDDPNNADGNAVAYFSNNKTAVALYGEYGTTFCIKGE